MKSIVSFSLLFAGMATLASSAAVAANPACICYFNYADNHHKGITDENACKPKCKGQQIVTKAQAADLFPAYASSMNPTLLMCAECTVPCSEAVKPSLEKYKIAHQGRFC